MGLRAEIDADIREALLSDEDLADAVSEVTLIKYSVGEQANPLLPSRVEEKTYTAKLAVISDYGTKDTDGEMIKIGDKQIFMLQSDVVATPEPNDKIRSAGQEFVVISVSEDPAKVSWTVQVRTNGESK